MRICKREKCSNTMEHKTNRALFCSDYCARVDWAARHPEKAKAAVAKYHNSERGKAVIATYVKSDARKQASSKYSKSPKGLLCGRRAANKRHALKRNQYNPSYEMIPFDAFTECVICGSTENIDMEHKIPASKGGEWSLKNIWPMCKKCNRGEGGKHTKDLYEWLEAKEAA